MNKRKWIALMLVCGLTFSFTGNRAVFGSDVTISDDPSGDDGLLDDDLIDDFPDDWVDEDWVDDDLDGDDLTDTPDDTDPADTPATDAPQTEAPATEAPATEAPTYTPETSAPVYTPAPQTWTETYYEETPSSDEESYEEDGEDGPSGGPEDIEDNGLTIKDFLILDKEDAQEAFDLPDASELPPQMYLRVPDLLQKPELPTGCEATALTMVLQYEEFDIDKEALAYTYQIYNREDDNMAVGYVGSPFTDEGAGCFAPAMAATAEHYFQANGVSYHAYDITGTEMDQLYAYVASGAPVIVWTTMNMEEPEFTEEQGEFEDRTYPWYRQEHCVVLTGYNLEEGTVQVNDPLDGVVTRDIETFTDIYQKTGMNAVVVGEYEDAADSSQDAQAEDGGEAAEGAPAQDGGEVLEDGGEVTIEVPADNPEDIVVDVS